MKLTANAIMADGSSVDVSNLATWTVDRNATVGKTGKVVATGAGLAKVSAKFAGAQSSKSVNITA